MLCFGGMDEQQKEGYKVKHEESKEEYGWLEERVIRRG